MVELYFLDTKAAVMDRKQLICLDEIESQAVVGVNGEERAFSCGATRNSE
jgi:hypothetical protein